MKKKSSSRMKNKGLHVQGVDVTLDGTTLVRGVTLDIQPGSTHLLMGPNGSGKSTLLSALMGHPRYKITKGVVIMNGKKLIEEPAYRRARAGLFLAFQHPPSIAGLPLTTFLRAAKNELGYIRQTPTQFMEELKSSAATLAVDRPLYGRAVNEGLSGGEKKKTEVLQMLVLKPSMVMFDEIDSGLDVDALKKILTVLKQYQEKQNAGYLFVSHNPAILATIKPDAVHILSGGRIVASGGADLAKKIHRTGFESFLTA